MGNAQHGVIAAGHPLTAEAGAEILREGGNAVDAAVCAVLTSFAVESPLTGLGAGGFMVVQAPSIDGTVIDFFVEVPGRGGDAEERGDLLPVSVVFDQTPQIFNIGAASCGVPGTAAGLWEVSRRFGTVPFEELVKPGVRHAREGTRVVAMHAYIYEILEPVLTEHRETRELYAPEGRMLREGDTFRFPELAEALEWLAAEGPEPFYSGEIARRIVEWVRDRGGLITGEDLAAYEPIERAPAQARYRDRQVLTNPPPSSGGILIAFCLDLLERLGPKPDLRTLVEVMKEANLARTEEFSHGLYEASYLGRFLSQDSLGAAQRRVARRLQDRSTGGSGPAATLGSTTHIAVMDAAGGTASVTCSNGCGSGILVPGTGVHLNNMLGEEDLNPLGFHVHAPGTRVTSMMAPTIVLRDGVAELALGSAGSNRIRSAILQTIMAVVDEGIPVEEATRKGRAHFENDVVHAEPGIDAAALDRLEELGYAVERWRGINLYFGGVQAAARDPLTGALSGGGDPRRGGAALTC